MLTLPETTMGWGGVVIGAVMFFLFLWKRREDRRTRAVKAASIFGKWGSIDLEELFEAYAIGNYLGTKSVLRIMRRLIRRVREEGVPKMFTGLSDRIVDYQLKDKDGRKALSEKLRIAEAIAILKAKPEDDPTPDVDELVVD